MSVDPVLAPEAHRHGDFSRNNRLILLSMFALVIGVISSVGAALLLAIIRFFTNLFFFQAAVVYDRAPASNHLGVA